MTNSILYMFPLKKTISNSINPFHVINISAIIVFYSMPLHVSLDKFDSMGLLFLDSLQFLIHSQLLHVCAADDSA